MRKDFQKLLCECYKEGRGGAMTSKHMRAKVRNSRVDEDGAYYSSKLPLNKMRGWDRKGFGENLAPLKRFINKQLGRPWDKVYSEICQFNKKTGAVGIHIFQHLYQYITVKTRKEEDGRVFDAEYTYRHYDGELRFGDLYVDPNDNIIKKYKRNKFVPYHRRYKPDPTKDRRVKIHDYLTLAFVDGIWYRYDYEDLPDDGHVIKVPHRDDPHMFTEKVVFSERYCHDYRMKVCRPSFSKFAIHKKQLSGKELEEFGCQNL